MPRARPGSARGRRSPRAARRGARPRSRHPSAAPPPTPSARAARRCRGGRPRRPGRGSRHRRARGSRRPARRRAGIASSTRTRSDCRRASKGGGGSSRSNHGPSTCEVRNTASRSQLRSTSSSQCTRASAAPRSRWSTWVATGRAPSPSASIARQRSAKPASASRNSSTAAWSKRGSHPAGRSTRGMSSDVRNEVASRHSQNSVPRRSRSVSSDVMRPTLDPPSDAVSARRSPPRRAAERAPSCVLSRQLDVFAVTSRSVCGALCTSTLRGFACSLTGMTTLSTPLS